MSLPPFPSFSGRKPSELKVYTIEECQSCKQKMKRDFKVGDYIMSAAGTCEKCQGQKLIVQIYGEKIDQSRADRGRGSGLPEEVRPDRRSRDAVGEGLRVWRFSTSLGKRLRNVSKVDLSR
jgi:hypothetical protein